MADVERAPSKLGPALAKRGAQILISQALMLGLALLGAGTWRWTEAWLFAGLSLALVLVNFAYVLPRNPAIIAARSRMGEGTKGFDKVFAALSVLGQLAQMVVCGLDAVRFGWSAFPGWVPWLGLGLLVLANVPIAWALGENPYLEATVRIQAEREHRVITTGPYAVVRHPMYVGVLVQYVATPLALGSAWGLVISAYLVVLLVVRTSLEDRTLRAELPGYAEFAEQTRHRLIPGIW
jgi:protein-S-isoprenylcysteine O-methyltransferase Ste14